MFKEHGVNEVLGLDGKWINKELLLQNIDENEFIEVDLESDISIDRKFDLAISLEVAEHLSKKRSESFVRDLCKLSDSIIFSAAIPFQGGQNHINEQPLSYWVDRFYEHGYKCLDVFRSEIWNDEEIFWWYRQNVVFFKNDKVSDLKKFYPPNYVHPELYSSFCEAYSYKNLNAIKLYFKKMVKALLYKIFKIQSS